MKTIKTTLLLLSLCVMNQFANAQIVYTDINPDLTGGQYGLDLNNDGITDFNISAFNMNDANGYSSYVRAYGLNGNSVALSSLNSFYAKGFTSGSTIDASVVWATQGTLKSKYNYCVPFGSCSSGGSGSFGGGDKYLGLRLIVNGQTYYGWARLKKVAVSNNTASFVIRDYAYDNTPSHSIIAASISGARLAVENSLIESDIALNVFPNPVSNSTTISFSLPKSEKISLKIFDVNGRLVTILSEQVFEAGENELVWNADDVCAGIYFFQFQTAENLQTVKLIVTK